MSISPRARASQARAARQRAGDRSPWRAGATSIVVRIFCLQSRRRARCRAGPWAFCKLRDDGIVPLICPTCQNVFAGIAQSIHASDRHATLHGVVFDILVGSMARGHAFPDHALPIRIGDSLDLKFPVVDDPESRICIFLTEYRDAVDREHGDADCRKPVPQHRQDRLASLGVQPTRQCHVEAEIFHDIGIAPAVEVLALPLRQPRSISSLAIIWRERCTE